MTTRIVKTYDIDDSVILKATVTNDSGVATDPTDVIFDIKEPDGTIITKTRLLNPSDVTRLSAGIFEYNFKPTKSGRHYYTIEVTGTYASRDSWKFDVRYLPIGLPS